MVGQGRANEAQHRAALAVESKNWTDIAVFPGTDVGAGLVRPVHTGEQAAPLFPFQGGDPARRRGWLAVLRGKLCLVLVVHHQRRGGALPVGDDSLGILGRQTPGRGVDAPQVAGPSVAGGERARREELDATGGGLKGRARCDEGSYGHRQQSATRGLPLSVGVGQGQGNSRAGGMRGGMMAFHASLVRDACGEKRSKLFSASTIPVSGLERMPYGRVAGVRGALDFQKQENMGDGPPGRETRRTASRGHAPRTALRRWRTISRRISALWSSPTPRKGRGGMRLPGWCTTLRTSFSPLRP